MTGKLKCEQMPCGESLNWQLTFVEKHNNFVKWIHKIHVFVAILLNLQDQRQFGAIVCGESLEKLCVVPEMT